MKGNGGNPRCGSKFYPDYIGWIAPMWKALYSLKTGAFSWCEHLYETVHFFLELTAWYVDVDVDVWMGHAGKSDSSDVFFHSDKLLVLSANRRDKLMCLDQHYVLKPGSIGRSTLYLGSENGDYKLVRMSVKLIYVNQESFVVTHLRLWVLF
jgi:hypothetical protein